MIILHKAMYISNRTIKGLMPPATTVDDTDNLGEGDSHLVLDLLSEDENWMEKLKQEVQFRVMMHRGAVDILVSKAFRSKRSIPFAGGEVPRLVAVQGEINKDGRSLLCLGPTLQEIPVSDSATLYQTVTQSIGIQPTLPHPSFSSPQPCPGFVTWSKHA
jgi:hypothetical protein